MKNNSQIEKIIELAGEDKGIPIGALTSDNRDLWTNVCLDKSIILTKFTDTLLRLAKLFLQHLLKTKIPSPTSNLQR